MQPTAAAIASHQVEEGAQLRVVVRQQQLQVAQQRQRRVREQLEPATRLAGQQRGQRLKGRQAVVGEELDEGKGQGGQEAGLAEQRAPVRQRRQRAGQPPGQRGVLRGGRRRSGFEG